MDLAAADIRASVDPMALLSAILTMSLRRQTAIAREVVCIARHMATARLARLMLAVHRASGEQTVTVTQLELARLMGLQRTSVNAAVAALHGLGAVRVIRGRFTIVDAAALERAACCA